MNKEDIADMLSPAIYKCDASGREKNPCLLYKQKIKKDEKIVELFSSAFKGKNSYSKRLHLRCFFKVLCLNFNELIDRKFTNEIIKEIVTDSL